MYPEMSCSMMSEIREQPGIVRDLVNRREEITAGFVSLMSGIDVQKIYLVGAGSPLYAAEVLRYAAIKLLHVDAVAVPPSLFNAHVGFDLEHLSPEQMLLICPAESGRSKGQVDAARSARAAGIPIACTTLNPMGVLARECDVVLTKPAGHEEAYVTTKGQTIALTLIYMCLLDAACELGRISDAEHDRCICALEKLPENIEATIASSLDWFYRHEENVMTASSYRLIGYGANFGTINEGALKISEATHRAAFCYELEESLHGPIISMGAQDMVFLFATEDGDEKSRTFELAKLLHGITSRVVVVQSDREPSFDDDSLLVHTGNVEFIDAIEYQIPAQVLSCCISNALGIDTTVDPYDDLHKNMETKYED